MAFDFPASPTTGQTYTDVATGMVYTFDGVVWAPGAGGIQTTSPYVLKTGDAMLGFLSLVGAPTAALHATPKQWVEQLVAQESLFQGVWQVAANQPDLTPAVMNPLHSYSWIAQTVDPSIPEIAPAALPGIGGVAIAATDTVIWNNTLQLYEHIRGAVSVSQMLVADAPPAVAFHGQQWMESDSGKIYVYYDDGTSQQWVQTSGGGGATKAEVYFGDTAPDPTFSGELWWDTSTGNMMINQAGTWVQTNVEEAPLDGQAYFRQNAAWASQAATSGITQPEADLRYLQLTGGTVNGNVKLQTGDLQLRNTGGYNSSSVVIEGLADSGAKLCDIRIFMGGEAGAGGWEFWTENGVNWSTTWAFKTTVASPPGIDVQGTASVATLADRSLLADPEFAQFACGEGESRGVNLGQLLRWAVLEVIELKAEIAQLKGRK